MIALLGFVTFDLLDGFSADSTQHTATFAKHDVIAGLPKLQAMGNDLSTRRLSIRLHHRISDPEGTYHQLRLQQQLQQPLPLVLGSGSFEGLYVIESIGDKTLFTNDEGEVLARDLSLSLQEYPIDIQDLLNFAMPSPLLGVVGNAGQGLPLEAVSTAVNVMAVANTAQAIVSSATASYRNVSASITQLSDVLNKDGDWGGLSAKTSQTFANLVTNSAALHTVKWSSNWGGLSTAVYDFTRYTAQAANQFQTALSVLAENDKLSSLQALSDVDESLKSASKSSSKMTAWLSVRGGVSV